MLATATQLASSLMRICGSAAWEVDAALRPEGKAGALVRTPTGLASYYQRWAHTWEFQALLKARPAAGDPELGQQFLDITAPGVWSAAGRDSFVDDVQAMRRRVEDNIPERQRDRELKLGAGGLRDVEFAVQLLQLVHGRTDPDLRLPGTLMGLRSLIRGGYVGRSDGAEMAAAYTFLRRAEHRLQLQRLRRTHLLPEDSSDMEWLARSDGYSASGSASAAEVFIAERVRHSGTVRRLHEKLFYRPLLHAVAAVGTDEMRLSPEAARARLAALGFMAPDAALRHLAALTVGVSRRAAIQRTLLPVLLDYFSSSPDPDGGLLSYRQVSEALADTPWYLRLLRDEGSVAQRLATLLGGSRLIASLLTRAPEVLRLLVDDAALLEPEPETVAAALLARSRRAGSAREAVDAARSARRQEMLRLACGDLLGLISVTNIARGLTSVAETTHAGGLRRRGQAGHRRPRRLPGPVRGDRDGPARRRRAGLLLRRRRDVRHGAAAGRGRAGRPRRRHGRRRPDDPAARAGRRRTRRWRSTPTCVPRARTARWSARWSPTGGTGRRPRRRGNGRRCCGPDRWSVTPNSGPSSSARRTTSATRRAACRCVTWWRSAGSRPGSTRNGCRAARTRPRTPSWVAVVWPMSNGRSSCCSCSTRSRCRACGHRPPCRRSPPRRRPGLISEADAAALTNGWLEASHTRNAIMLVRGKPEDQIPRQGRELAAVARALGYPAGGDPGEFVDDYRRATRRARKVVDRIFDGG